MVLVNQVYTKNNRKRWQKYPSQVILFWPKPLVVMVHFLVDSWWTMSTIYLPIKTDGPCQHAVYLFIQMSMVLLQNHVTKVEQVGCMQMSSQVMPCVYAMTPVMAQYYLTAYKFTCIQPTCSTFVRWLWSQSSFICSLSMAQLKNI